MGEVVIWCPECAKSIGFQALGARHSACPHCGTPLDLSAFVPASKVAPRAVPAVVPTPVVGDPAPTTPASTAPATPAPHGHPHGHHHHHHHHHRPRGRGQGTTVLIIVTLVAAVVGAVVLLGRGSRGTMSTAVTRLKGSVNEREAAEADELRAAMGRPVPSPVPWVPPESPVSPLPSGEPRERAARARELEPDKRPPIPRKEVELLTYPYLPDVSAEDQNRVEEAVRAALDVGGRAGRDAEKALVSMGWKAAPRLIGEFKAVKDSYGLERQEGLVRAMVLDRVLRKIDGVQERLFGDPRPIHVDSDPKSALETIRNWNWWWASEEYRKRPRKPWNPAVDEKDEKDASSDR